MKNNLLTQILIAFIIAIIIGALVGPAISIVKPLGDLFLRLISFIVAPLILSSLVIGMSSIGDPKRLGSIGGKTIVYFLITTSIAVFIGVIFGLVIAPGSGVNLPAPQSVAEPPQSDGVIQTLLAIIPTNPFAGLAEGKVLQIIFFAIMLGLGITLLGEKAKPVHQFFDSFAEVMYKITSMIMRVAPFGVFGLIAPVVGTHGLTVLMPLIKLVLSVAIACILHALIVYSFAVKSFAKMSPLTFLKGISPAALVAFSTCSSSGTLPVTMKNTQENLGVSNKITSFVLPLGATINMDGTAIYQGIAALFIAQFYGIELTFTQMITIVLMATLASIGAAGVPGAGLVMLTMVLSSVNLPLEGIALVAGVDRILDMFRTSVNVVGDASCAVVVAKSEGELNQPA